jgi:hypothetical protein
MFVRLFPAGLESHMAYRLSGKTLSPCSESVAKFRPSSNDPQFPLPIPILQISCQSSQPRSPMAKRQRGRVPENALNIVAEQLASRD